MLVFSLFRNPTVIQTTPGDLLPHKVTGFPADNTNVGQYMVTSVAGAGGSGSGFWIWWNQSGVPSDTTKAWWVHGSGQVLVLGGGVSNVYVQASVATDLILLAYES
jgi:hypothetical protein